MLEMLFSNQRGELFDGPGIGLVGRLGDNYVEPAEEEMIPLPSGATLTMIPNRRPIGLDVDQGQFVPLENNPYNNCMQEPIYAVGALLPQGFTRTLLPAFYGGKGKEPLPLLGYSAVGIKDGQYYVAAMATDEDHKWNPAHYNTSQLENLVKEKLKQHPKNRIIHQLAKCSLEYGCFTAQNMFYQRWEAGIPVSPSCNAQCVGCISEQASECCPAPQRRLEFTPSVAEVVELAESHLLNAEDGIISFGQGCEGEPSLQATLVSKAIGEIRKTTTAGTINMNTNAGYTEGLKELCDAGIDSLRVSINSAISESYQPYYQPKNNNYSFESVEKSLEYATENGVYVSLNLLAFPGVTDREEEVEALINLVKKTGINFIQLRNLNIDPDMYMNLLPKARGEAVGIPEFIRIIARELPQVGLGNYSRNLR